MSIVNLLNQIKHEEVVLPAIQRDFVWPEDKVLRLLDSIMRGYPIGIALLWETYLDLQYRKFNEAFHSGQIHQGDRVKLPVNCCGVLAFVKCTGLRLRG